MLATALSAVATALFLWWFSTGLLFWLARHARSAYGVLGLGGGILAVSLAGLAATAPVASVPAVYLSFLCGIGAWAFLEISFLTGLITGPVKIPCPPQVRGFERFTLALGTLLWHELAILAVGVVMWVIVWGAENQVGAWAFTLLMGMRISAKLNLFLGVPYPPSALLPTPLAHLRSYFRERPFTPLLPAVITTSTALATLVAWHAADPAVTAVQAVGLALIWTLLVLGILEHWFLILPVREGALWSWFTGLPAGDGAPQGRPHGAPDRVKASASATRETAPTYLPGLNGSKTTETKPSALTLPMTGTGNA
ncbi:MAG: putative photosynthetic complex assembly protein PuhE [Pseudomonadota bacterium]